MNRETRFLWTCGSVWVFVSLIGCADRSPSPPTAQEAQKLDAGAVLERMVATYRGAASYRDRGVLRLSFQRGGQRFQDKSPLSVCARAQTQLAVRAYHATVICDGKRFLARIEDPGTKDIGGQVLLSDAPASLDLKYLYRDPVLRDALTSGLGRQPVQLELLYGENPLEAVFQTNVPKTFLASQDFDGHPCYRVEATTEEGNFVFWVDREAFLLRRLEYPVATILPQLTQEGEVSEATLIAEFTAARLNHGLPVKAFEIRVPKNGVQVRHFVLPPQPLPSDLFGERPDAFSFATMDGDRVDSERLLGRNAVLVWFHDHPVCRACVRRLEKVYLEHGDSEETGFYAVCTEPASRSTDSLQGLMTQWRVTMPIVRDLEAFGRDVFRIPWAPTMVVLDAEGKIQAFEVGANPQLEQQLPLLLQQLASGEDVAANTLATYRQSEQTYSRMLEAATGSGKLAGHVVSARVSPATQPRRVRLSMAWDSKDAKQPGNLLVLPALDDEVRILALDGSDAVLEIDDRGKTRSRHELDVETPGVTFLRTAVNDRGSRYYVGASIQGERAYVFDGDLRRIGSYPPDANLQGTIADATLMDVDRDGQLELAIGFGQLAGVHCATLTGQRKWENRQMSDVLSLVVRDRLMASGRRGDIIPFDPTGRPESAVVVNGRAIFHLFAAQFPPRMTAYCGLTFDEAGVMVAVGLSPDFQEVWEYRLPGGVFQDPVQFVTSGAWLRSGQGTWVFAGPDGSIHVLSEDGTKIDGFASGQRVVGLGLSQVAGCAYLFLAGPDGIKAWQVTDVGERLGFAPQ